MSYFTLRIIIILMEIIKDVYISAHILGKQRLDGEMGKCDVPRAENAAHFF